MENEAPKIQYSLIPSEWKTRPFEKLLDYLRTGIRDSIEDACAAWAYIASDDEVYVFVDGKPMWSVPIPEEIRKKFACYESPSGPWSEP